MAIITIIMIIMIIMPPRQLTWNLTKYFFEDLGLLYDLVDPLSTVDKFDALQKIVRVIGSFPQPPLKTRMFSLQFRIHGWLAGRLPGA